MPPQPFIERWDLATGKLVDRFKTGWNNPPLLFSGSKGLWSYTADTDIRDALTGRLVRILKMTEADKAGGFHSSAAAISADGASVAIAGFSSFAANPQNRILVFELRTGELTRILRQDGPWPVHGLRFLPDGRLISVADVATVWDAVPRKP